MRRRLTRMREEEVHGGHGEENHTELCFASRCPGRKPLPGTEKEAHTEARMHGALFSEPLPGAKAQRAKHCFRACERKPAGGCPASKPLPATKRGSPHTEARSFALGAAAQGESPAGRKARDFHHEEGGSSRKDAKARSFVSRAVAQGESLCRPPSGGFSPRGKRGSHQGTELCFAGGCRGR